MPTTKEKAPPKMSDEAVKAKTGKTWKQWFSILDKAGAQRMTHQEIVKYLSEKQSVGPWWCQMVTVTYEQQTGKRELHEKPGGYQISVSRTVASPVARLYKAFAKETERASWLNEDGLEIRKATPNKSMRVTWKDKKTSLEINFYPKNADKSQVVVQHSKLANASAAAKMKIYWAKALDRLRESVE
jgi:Activator of Hsp90 ATPase homolog 1-like protein